MLLYHLIAGILGTARAFVVRCFDREAEHRSVEAEIFAVVELLRGGWTWRYVVLLLHFLMIASISPVGPMAAPQKPVSGVGDRDKERPSGRWEWPYRLTPSIDACIAGN
jgi:hypothetical protein